MAFFDTKDSRGEFWNRESGVESTLLQLTPMRMPWDPGLLKLKRFAAELDGESILPVHNVELGERVIRP